MNTEALFNLSCDEDNDEKLIKSIHQVMNEWVYFFFAEKAGKNTPISTGNIEHIIVTGKDNPIHIPLIQNEDGVHGVIYFTQNKAKNSAEFNCNIAKMKGHKALAFFYQLEPIDAVYLQADDNNVRIPRSEMEKILTNHNSVT